MCDGYDLEQPMGSVPPERISFLKHVLKSCQWYVLSRRIELGEKYKLSPKEEAERVRLNGEYAVRFDDSEEHTVAHLAAIVERTFAISPFEKGVVIEAFFEVYRVFNADDPREGLTQIVATLRSLGVTEFPERHDADKQVPEGD